MNYLRSCTAGGGHWAAHNSTSFGGRFYCPLHLWSLLHGFDPQPDGHGGTDTTVRFIDGSVPSGWMHAERDETTYVVLARDGDMLTLRRLGFPNDPHVQAPVSAVYPDDPGAVYRHASRCGVTQPKRVTR